MGEKERRTAGFPLFFFPQPSKTNAHSITTISMACICMRTATTIAKGYVSGGFRFQCASANYEDAIQHVFRTSLAPSRHDQRAVLRKQVRNGRRKKKKNYKQKPISSFFPSFFSSASRAGENLTSFNNKPVVGKKKKTTLRIQEERRFQKKKEEEEGGGGKTIYIRSTGKKKVRLFNYNTDVEEINKKKKRESLHEEVEEGNKKEEANLNTAAEPDQ